MAETVDHRTPKSEDPGSTGSPSTRSPEKSEDRATGTERNTPQQVKDVDVDLSVRIAIPHVQVDTIAWTVLFLILGLATRLYQVGMPDSVAWDETHFGKFANHYLKRQFYFDVHPPLAKMIIALAGHLTGYDGGFDFEEPGQAYPNSSYIGMRVVCAIFGALCVPMSYLIVDAMAKSQAAAIITATLVLCDTALVTISQYILLDPILMFFILASALAAIKADGARPFSAAWWSYLTLTGIMLGCAFACKWVGLFIVLTIGLLTIRQLWDILGDLSISLQTFGLHFAARAITLIVVPVCVYLATFFIHFQVCNHSGPGDAFMSSAFQTQLIGNELYNDVSPHHIAYGSIISLKSSRWGGGMLHSHPHLFPEPLPEQQQVTAYQYKDANNDWLIKPASLNSTDSLLAGTPTFVRSGDKIRLEHVLTRRNLHTHPINAAVKSSHKHVTAYGESGVGDIYDEWEIRLVGGKLGDRIGRIRDRILLVHPYMHCALHSDGTQLPEWGFQQLEVTCNPNINDANNHWNVEAHRNDRLPSDKALSDSEAYSTSFLQDVIELHIAMSKVNSGLVPKEGEDPSRPWEWPLNYRGQIFTRFGPNDYRVYLLGNIFVFWVFIVSAALFLLLCAVELFAWRRQWPMAWWRPGQHPHLLTGGAYALTAWALHYLPFFLMGRVLYFHHYMPALLFACMLSGTFLAFVIRLVAHFSPAAEKVLLTVLSCSIVASFAHVCPLSYGMVGPLENYAAIKYLSSWPIA